MLKDWLISIHAPTRGATAVTTTKETDPVFQSTLPRGERQMTLVIFLLKMVFQSTLPRGERRLRISVFLLIRWISIHAPTRGATRRNLPVLLLCSYFNPRSHEGSDTRLPSCFFSLFYFNPRSHEGSDTNMSLEKAVENISIHAPTRGATAAAPLTTAPSRISIHAPTRGATRVYRICYR